MRKELLWRKRLVIYRLTNGFIGGSLGSTDHSLATVLLVLFTKRNRLNVIQVYERHIMTFMGKSVAQSQWMVSGTLALPIATAIALLK